VLRAADPATLERFYLAVLGLSFEKRQSELAQLRAGNALIDIVPADKAGPAGGISSTGGANLDHLCLRIEPFDAAAITKHRAEHHVACGAETLRYGAEGEGPSIYLRDPVVQYLISKGVSPKRLVAAGSGEFQPIDPADTEEAFRRNRRIELKLTER
jgi:glyoxylase I family protein